MIYQKQKKEGKKKMTSREIAIKTTQWRYACVVRLELKATSSTVANVMVGIHTREPMGAR